ncbi:MAG: type II secretion system protein [Candidatus Omnitrophica bacterium]|nr:type II secretion system protein [Candidatus Omnitrophota bacterium]
MKRFGVPRGMTLLEIMVSMIILAIVLVSIVTLMVVASGLSARINCEYTAANIAKSRVEDARGLIKTSGFTALTDAKFGETDTKLDQNGIPDENGLFRRSTTVTTNYSSNPRLTRVSVNTFYYVRGIKSKHLTTMTTYFVNM